MGILTRNGIHNLYYLDHKIHTIILSTSFLVNIHIVHIVPYIPVGVLKAREEILKFYKKKRNNIKIFFILAFLFQINGKKTT